MPRSTSATWGSRLAVDAGRSPEHGDLAAGHRLGEPQQRGCPATAATGGCTASAGQQRDADAGGHHLAQRLEAGGPEPAALVRPRRAGTPRAPGRAGSGPPRAAARARWRAPHGSTGSTAPASAVVGGHGEHEVLGEQRLARAAGRRATGRASTPTSSWPSRRRWSTTSVFSSTSSSSRCGNRCVERRHDVGQQVRRQRREQPHAAACPASGSAACRAMPRMLSASAEDDPRRARPPARPASVSRTLPGLRSISSTPSSLLELLDLRRQRRLADEAGLGGAAEVPVLGHGDQVLEVAQVHGCASGRRPPSGSTTRPAACRPRRPRPGASAGAEVRIRWSKALSAAVEPGAHGDHDLLVRHRGAVAGGEHAGHRRLAPLVDHDLAARRQLDRALEPLGVGQQADLHEHAVERRLVRARRSTRSS